MYVEGSTEVLAVVVIKVHTVVEATFESVDHIYESLHRAVCVRILVILTEDKPVRKAFGAQLTVQTLQTGPALLNAGKVKFVAYERSNIFYDN